MAEELTVIGILNERDFEAQFTICELRKHFFNCLQLGPMFEPLIKVLKDTNKFLPNPHEDFD